MIPSFDCLKIVQVPKYDTKIFYLFIGNKTIDYLKKFMIKFPVNIGGVLNISFSGAFLNIHKSVMTEKRHEH